MGFTVCPAAAIAAPVEVVWANLVHWERYAEWADVWVERLEPSNPITLGQSVIFTGKAFGRILRFSFRSTRSIPNDSGSMVSVLPLRAARENTPCLHAHRCDQLSRPIWLRLPLPPRLGVGSSQPLARNHSLPAQRALCGVSSGPPNATIRNPRRSERAASRSQHTVRACLVVQSGCAGSSMPSLLL